MSIGELLITITICLMVITFSGWGISVLLDHIFEFSETKKHIPIKFKSFVALYNLKPASWTLYDNFICYRRSVFRQSPFGCGHHDVETTNFKFSFPDLLKYRRWRKRLKKNEKTMKDAKEFSLL